MLRDLPRNFIPWTQAPPIIHEVSSTNRNLLSESYFRRTFKSKTNHDKRNREIFKSSEIPCGASNSLRIFSRSWYSLYIMDNPPSPPPPKKKRPSGVTEGSTFLVTGIKLLTTGIDLFHTQKFISCGKGVVSKVSLPQISDCSLQLKRPISNFFLMCLKFINSHYAALNEISCFNGSCIWMRCVFL